MRIRTARGRGFKAFATMSDISFLLLIFLVICSAMNEADDIDLPRFRETRKTGFENSVSITVGMEGLYEWEGRSLDLTALGEAMASLEGEALVVKVKADREAPYADVAALLSTLGDLDIRNVQLLAEPDAEAR